MAQSLRQIKAANSKHAEGGTIGVVGNKRMRMYEVTEEEENISGSGIQEAPCWHFLSAPAVSLVTKQSLSPKCTQWEQLGSTGSCKVSTKSEQTVLLLVLLVSSGPVVSYLSCERSDVSVRYHMAKLRTPIVGSR